MGDIITAQTIHYVVKDYQRMFNAFHALVEENKELREKVERQGKRLSTLQGKVQSNVSNLSAKTLKGQVNAMKSLLDSANGHLNKAQTRLSDISKLLEKLNEEMPKDE